ncbi:MAG: DMT family transporter [Sedimentisphaerales bacterium]|nr:DMT family transporter [Sedimentisphaerales bacterium]
MMSTARTSSLGSHSSALPDYRRLFLTALFWGGTFVAGKVLAQDLNRPYSVSFLRFFIAGIVLTLFVFIRLNKLPLPSLQEFSAILLLSITGVAGYNICFLKGLQTDLPAARASMIVATCPVFIAIGSAVFFNERLNLLKIFGILLSICGATVVISRGDPKSLFLGQIGIGELFILGCVLFWTIYSLTGKTLMHSVSPLLLVAYSAVIGAALLFPFALYEGLIRDLQSYTIMNWIEIGYLALLGTVIGFVWYYQGVKNIGPTRAGLFINFVPVWGVILSVLILDEMFTWSLLAGGVLVFVGVWLTNRPIRNVSDASPAIPEF